MTCLCRNGHITGFRHCPMCGADRDPRQQVGTGRAEVKRHEKDRSKDPDWKLRCDTRVGSGPLGPNKNNNVTG